MSMTNNDELKARIENALTDFTHGRAVMHVPAQNTDVDLVLADCLELLAERDADKEEIATLQSRNRRLEGIITAAEKRIAELEARTVSVKLPALIGPEAAPAHYWENGESMAYADGYNKATSDAKNLCAAAGIKLEVGE